MKPIMITIGIVLVLVSLISIMQYLPIYNELSEYGQGALLGKVLIFFIGVLLIYFGFRKKNVHNKE
jgi:hypothetical protein